MPRSKKTASLSVTDARLYRERPVPHADCVRASFVRSVMGQPTAGVKQLAAGMHNSMALLEDGTVMTWCAPHHKLLRRGAPCRCEPCRNGEAWVVLDLLTFVVFLAGSLMRFELRDDLRGRGDYCQLGTGPPPREDSHSVVPVKCYPMTADLPPARLIDSGDSHCLLVTNDDALFTWGFGTVRPADLLVISLDFTPLLSSS